MAIKIFSVSSIENTFGVNSLGGLTQNLLKLNLDSDIDGSIDITSIRFSRGSTLTTIDPGKTNIPSDLNKKVLTTNNRIRNTGVSYLDSYTALDLLFSGSLLSALRNNSQPLDVSTIGTSSIVLSIELNLDEQKVSYVPFSGTIVTRDPLEPLVTQDILDNLNSLNLYIDDLYSASESLDIAWTESPELGYIGQIKILDELFKILEYEDNSEYPEIPQEIINNQNRKVFNLFLSRINPYKVTGFRELLTETSESSRTEEERIRPLIKINTIEKRGVLDKIEFTSEGVALRAGQRITVNTPDFTKRVDIVVERLNGVRKSGFVLFSDDSGDLDEDNLLEESGGIFYIGAKTATDDIQEKLSMVEIIKDPLDPAILQLVRASNKSVVDVLISLDEKLKETIFPLVNESELPPGISNSARSNANVNAPTGFVHYRPYATPFNPQNYCSRFTENQNCNDNLPPERLNTRSDNKNRNAFAILEVARYANELPLGFISEIGTPLVTQEYEDYWNTYGNKEPEGGCLSFLDTDNPNNTKLCYNVRRCTKRGLRDLTTVLQCVEDSMKGKYNLISTRQRTIR